ncbi:MAG: Short-chain-enoyl-CoA hydratase [Luteibacter sp.]|uniref:enoyl-CoA hydratase/isomerase family protein n=1 Tax=Luteibacter sp. TaxID=1886636 RepID=UPI00137C4668|nr:enoyl-CoA hydratase/isomerase family protein [Luteibacter sp.]KAF1004777.1 MAG: Short-chain-enoyl-CoA hydratase [Luteibacter sp.]
MNAPVDIEPSVLFEERTAHNGKRIGIATLNAPKTLNGLSLEMATLLTERFDAWADDEDVAVVVLQGAGEKALCAGGDLHGLYRSMREYREAGKTDIRQNTYAAEFFEVEYRLDHRIHTYPKPVLCWGHGIVMGGGIGLMSGASHRVVTERSKLAFPEITVGLYPDVGGSWLLARLPDHGGLFLGLTGALLNASDAIAAKLADWQLAEADRETVYTELLSTAWKDDDAVNATLLAELLGGRAVTPEPGPFRRHAAHIAQLCSAGDLDAVIAAIHADTSDDPWLKAARDTLVAGSPGSARLAFELQRRAKDMSLAEVFRMEYGVSLHCAAHGDFEEGIRALLIDKDRSPRWNPATQHEADARWSERFFTSPWNGADHPLADLTPKHS